MRLLKFITPAFGFTALRKQVSPWLHIAASSPHIIHPSQGTYEHLADDMIRSGRYEIHDGSINVTGLGIELDEEKVNKYHDDFLQIGEQGFPGYSPIKEADSQRPKWTPKIHEY